jgi:large subunit ribosomal protein L21
MYAIVEIAGQQFKVRKDQQLYVHRLEAEEGSKVDFDRVLLIDNEGKVNVGAPVIDGASVSVKVLKHLKGEKVIVFKKKRRKGYQKKNGHRQYLSQIQIEKITEKGAKPKAQKKAEPKAEAKPETKAKAPVKKEAASKAKPAAKKSAAKKTTTKKESAPKKETAAKSATAKKAAPKKTAAKKAAPKATKSKKETGDKSE